MKPGTMMAAACRSALVLAALAAPARAQTPPAPLPAAGFQDGFFIQSADGENRLGIGLLAQADGRFAFDDPRPIINTFTMRKLRPTFTGRVAKYFDFKMMPDFGGGTAVLQDAWLDVRLSPAFRIRTGKDKVPIGYEWLAGDASVLFPERALASSLVPLRDVGIQAQGDLGNVFYAVGLFNGVPDAASSTTDTDTNNSKDLAGRIVVQPFKRPAHPGALNGLGVQVGGSTGRQIGALPSFKTSIQQTYFAYASGAAASGTRDRVSPAVFYFYKGVGAFCEYMRSAQAVTRSGVATDVANHAWEATASLLVTGDAASYGVVRPVHPFDPASHHWGAVQVLARISALTVDPAAFAAGLSATGASRTARAVAVGANWYPAAFIKYYAAFERTVFDGDAPGARPAEDALVLRAQLSF